MQKDILLHFWLHFLSKCGGNMKNVMWLSISRAFYLSTPTVLVVCPHFFVVYPVTLRLPGNKPQNGRKIYYCLLSQLLVQG